MGLLLGTKVSDILEWRILLWFKPLVLITLIFHLYWRNSISVSNYVQVGFAQFCKSDSTRLCCHVTLSNVCLTLLVSSSVATYAVCLHCMKYASVLLYPDTICLEAVALWRDDNGDNGCWKRGAVSLCGCVCFLHMAGVSVCVSVCGNVCLCYGY